jgi:hypothetical protein
LQALQVGGSKLDVTLTSRSDQLFTATGSQAREWAAANADRVESFQENVALQFSAVGAVQDPEFGLQYSTVPNRYRYSAWSSIDGFFDNAYTPPLATAPVHVFILAAGVNDHPDYHLDKTISYCAIEAAYCSDPFVDGMNKGTVAAGIIGGVEGVYSNAIIHSVRVIDEEGVGFLDELIRGMEWVMATVVRQRWTTPVIAIYSGGLGDFEIVANTIEHMALMNIAFVSTVVTGDYACTSKISTQGISVAGVDTSSGTLTLFDYIGPCADIYAPGFAIQSTFGTSEYMLFSGSDLAGPFVAGALAVLTARKPCLSAAQLKTALLAGATMNQIEGFPEDAPNRFLNLTHSDEFASSLTCERVEPPTVVVEEVSPVCDLDENYRCQIMMRTGVAYEVSMCYPGGDDSTPRNGSCYGNPNMLVSYEFDGVYSGVTYSNDACGACPYALLTFPETYGLHVNVVIQIGCETDENGEAVPCGGAVSLATLEAPSPPVLPHELPSPPAVVAGQKQKKKPWTMLIVLISLFGFFVLLIPVAGGIMVYLTKRRRRPVPRVAFVNR